MNFKGINHIDTKQSSTAFLKKKMERLLESIIKKNETA